MAACPNCAAPLRDGLRFCTQCGTPLLAAVVAQAAPDFDIAGDFGDDAVDDPGPVFEPVPALGSLASAPAERPSILGLLVDHHAGADVLAAEMTEPEPEPAVETAPEPAVETAPEPRPSTDAPAAAIHPLGVPVISARRPLGPGADPTHIGRASAYGAGAPRAGSTATVSPVSAPVATPSPASPASASPTEPPSVSVESNGSPLDGPEPRVSSPARAPRRYSPPPARSRAATWALVTGILPLAVSILGNLVTAELGRRALEATESGVTSGAWSPVFVALSLVFVINAALLTVCAISGVRGIRETGNGVTKGRALAVAGLAAGVVNLVLLVAGLAITISGLSTVLT